MPQQPSSKKIIYLADDDEDDRMLFADAVRDLNLQAVVVESADGQQLLNTLFEAQVLPEVIFLDINMPGKNGFDCLTEIRNTEGHLRNVKIIMLSTSSSISNIELADELGADFYAVKPSTFQGLKDLLRKVLDNDWDRIRKNRKKFLRA
ncbi:MULTISPECIES: response regulator [Flavobacterium]|uniref:response regulator n=1 Tax=Flavobacterium TaxID=237 RepID=UPI0021156DD4|nr:MULTISPECIES: response regulator [Flavobacterium]UUF13127.1 response regulator [Flavobacterium panici]